jgi:dienelactone hydrolase
MSRFAVLVLLLPSAGWGQAPDKKPLPPAEAKAAFLKLLDRPKVPLDIQMTGPHESKIDRDSRRADVAVRGSIASEAKADGTTERIPFLMRVTDIAGRADAPRPVVIVLHGTGGNKEAMRPWLDDLTDLGFAAVAIDARYHGDRVPGIKGSTAYVEAITKAWRTPAGRPREYPLYYDTVRDIWRLLDYLETRPDVDKSRIGMIGTSMGGIQTILAASVDDRVKVACPLIAAQSFGWSLAHDQWQGRAKTFLATHDAAARDLGEPAVNARVCRAVWDKVVPGLTSDFDMPNLVPLFAGRPLFLANGEADPNCPLGGAKLTFAAAETAFVAAGAADKLEIQVAPGVAHKVTDGQRAAALAFCKKWLRP